MAGMNLPRSFLLAISLAASAAFASACSSPSSTPPPVHPRRQITMRVDNTMQFGTPSIAVAAGQPLELSLENVGSMEHDFTLSDGVAQQVKIEAAGGQTASDTFTIDKPGTYQFVCGQPGHALAGMH